MSFGRQAWEEEAAEKRARDAQRYAPVMSAAGAPEDCQLTPFDCVILRQWIMGAGNEPPEWIVAASDGWLDEHGLDADALRPFGSSGPSEETTEAVA